LAPSWWWNEPLGSLLSTGKSSRMDQSTNPQTQTLCVAKITRAAAMNPAAAPFITSRGTPSTIASSAGSWCPQRRLAQFVAHAIVAPPNGRISSLTKATKSGKGCRQPPVNSRGFFVPKWPMFYPSNKRRLNRFCRAQKAFGYPYTGSCHVTVIHWYLCVFQISSKCPYKAFKPCQVSRKWNIVAEKCIWVPLGIFLESQESCQLQIITLNNTIIIT
jgi:hypothetical protein